MDMRHSVPETLICGTVEYTLECSSLITNTEVGLWSTATVKTRGVHGPDQSQPKPDLACPAMGWRWVAFLGLAQGLNFFYPIITPTEPEIMYA